MSKKLYKVIQTNHCKKSKYDTESVVGLLIGLNDQDIGNQIIEAYKNDMSYKLNNNAVIITHNISNWESKFIENNGETSKIYSSLPNVLLHDWEYSYESDSTTIRYEFVKDVSISFISECQDLLGFIP